MGMIADIVKCGECGVFSPWDAAVFVGYEDDGFEINDCWLCESCNYETRTYDHPCQHCDGQCADCDVVEVPF